MKKKKKLKSKEIKICIERYDNENTTIQNLWGSVKPVPTLTTTVQHSFEIHNHSNQRRKRNKWNPD